MSDNSAAVCKQLKIKTGSVKRLLKEHKLYNQEMEAQQRRVDQYIADGKDEYDIKNQASTADHLHYMCYIISTFLQKNILAESQKMVPDVQKRLGDAVVDLRELVVASRPTLNNKEEFVAAEEILEEAGV
ncbi:hypothetical protein BU17DRAFT_52644 [Hysterangium stoloniferum]|nr:hypothetical protein BU17DRAFT_52644 [Hysterangium stoloniferum]